MSCNTIVLHIKDLILDILYKDFTFKSISEEQVRRILTKLEDFRTLFLNTGTKLQTNSFDLEI